MSSQINDTKPAHNLTAVKPETISVHFRNVKSGISAKTLLKSLVCLHHGYCYSKKTPKTNQQTKPKPKPKSQTESTPPKTSNELSKIMLYHYINPFSSQFRKCCILHGCSSVQTLLNYSLLISFFMGYTVFATKKLCYGMTK